MESAADKRQAFDRRVASMVGAQLSGVRYYTMPDEPDFLDAGGRGTPWRVPDERFDFLEYGLDLTMSDGRIFGLTWGDTFSEYNLELLDHSIGPVGDVTWVWDVTGSDTWSGYLGDTIVQARSHWSALCTEDGECTDYPESIEMVFSSRKQLTVSALLYHYDTDSVGSGDGVVVVFDPNVARKLSIRHER